eukprot:GHVQ01001405.1.p1 GENE.GHVQ01001405.1~~GHVQ01001405.1.p1  ORF type:complete len:891 (+),score=127.03 GHVQ01001405.1:438-3110(+)
MGMLPSIVNLSILQGTVVTCILSLFHLSFILSYPPLPRHHKNTLSDPHSFLAYLCAHPHHLRSLRLAHPRLTLPTLSPLARHGFSGTTTLETSACQGRVHRGRTCPVNSRPATGKSLSCSCGTLGQYKEPEERKVDRGVDRSQKPQGRHRLLRLHDSVFPAVVADAVRRVWCTRFTRGGGREIQKVQNTKKTSRRKQIQSQQQERQQQLQLSAQPKQQQRTREAVERKKQQRTGCTTTTTTDNNRISHNNIISNDMIDNSIDMARDATCSSRICEQRHSPLSPSHPIMGRQSIIENRWIIALDYGFHCIGISLCPPPPRQVTSTAAPSRKPSSISLSNLVGRMRLLNPYVYDARANGYDPCSTLMGLLKHICNEIERVYWGANMYRHKRESKQAGELVHLLQSFPSTTCPSASVASSSMSIPCRPAPTASHCQFFKTPVVCNNSTHRTLVPNPLSCTSPLNRSDDGPLGVIFVVGKPKRLTRLTTPLLSPHTHVLPLRNPSVDMRDGGQGALPSRALPHDCPALHPGAMSHSSSGPHFSCYQRSSSSSAAFSYPHASGLVLYRPHPQHDPVDYVVIPNNEVTAVVTSRYHPRSPDSKRSSAGKGSFFIRVQTGRKTVDGREGIWLLPAEVDLMTTINRDFAQVIFNHFYGGVRLDNVNGRYTRNCRSTTLAATAAAAPSDTATTAAAVAGGGAAAGTAVARTGHGTQASQQGVAGIYTVHPCLVDVCLLEENLTTKFARLYHKPQTVTRDASYWKSYTSLSSRCSSGTTSPTHPDEIAALPRCSSWTKATDQQTSRENSNGSSTSSACFSNDRVDSIAAALILQDLISRKAVGAEVIWQWQQPIFPQHKMEICSATWSEMVLDEALLKHCSEFYHSSSHREIPSPIRCSP